MFRPRARHVLASHAYARNRILSAQHVAAEMGPGQPAAMAHGCKVLLSHRGDGSESPVLGLFSACLVLPVPGECAGSLTPRTLRVSLRVCGIAARWMRLSGHT